MQDENREEQTPVPGTEPAGRKLYGLGAEYHRLRPTRAMTLPPR